MDLQQAPTAAAGGSDQRNEQDTPLRGAWLIVARVVWVAIALLALSRFVAAVSAHYVQLTNPDEAVRSDLAQIGISVGSYAAYRVELAVVFVLVYYAVAAVIFWRRSDDGMALFVSLFLVTFGTNISYVLIDLVGGNLAWGWPGKFLEYLGWMCAVLFFYLFPNGRFVPRWTRPLAVLVAALQVPWTFFPNSPLSPDTWWPPLLQVLFLGMWGSGAFAQVYRYRRVSGFVERQQTKWVVFGAAAAVTGSMGISLLGVASPSLVQPGSLYEMVVATIGAGAFLFIPLTIGIAILRYRLWDIDIIINRTLVYGALTVCVVGIYVLVVGYLGAVFQTGGDLAISLVATGIVAVLFQPLRDRLQRGANRLIYGERDEPYAVISRLGQRLEVTLAPDDVLPTIAQTVREALKLPYAAILLKGSDAPAASVGEPAGEPLRLPLVYRNETIGELLVGSRGSGEPFGPTDRYLLDDLARQAGVAAHAVRLTADLQRSRERLVNAREEERRRLRRDLHDGLGAQLAGLNVQTGVLRRLIPRDPAAADELVLELRTELQTAIADIRRLVYDLRPPALDDLGLVAALRQLAERHGAESEQLQVLVEAPEELPPLPAAVEAAVYRIAQEALTNVVRHARARDCIVRISVADGVRLEIIDDGVGVPIERTAGVGLSSMRERAEELGGVCFIEPILEGGTRVLIELPLSKE